MIQPVCMEKDGCVCVCVSCINPRVVLSPQYFEVPFDSNMNRTKNRPLVRGQIRYSLCAYFTAFLSSSSVWTIWRGNPICTFCYFKKTVKSDWTGRERYNSSGGVGVEFKSSTTWQLLSLPSWHLFILDKWQKSATVLLLTDLFLA